MAVTSVEKDPEKLTMTITSEFDAPVDRVWKLWDDPRLLERWWGPPTYPATFVDHELAPGASVTYFMTGPDGDKSRGWWTVRTVAAPRALEFDEGFADESGAPNLDMPTSTMRVSIDAIAAGRTRMAIETTFASTEAMQQLLSMGMDEGMSEALGQIDGLLRAAA